MGLPSSAVCQEQSFAAQFEVWLPLPSDNRTCGLRREQDVCRRCRREKCEEHYLCKKFIWKSEKMKSRSPLSDETQLLPQLNMASGCEVEL